MQSTRYSLASDKLKETKKLVEMRIYDEVIAQENRD